MYITTYICILPHFNNLSYDVKKSTELFILYIVECIVYTVECGLLSVEQASTNFCGN